ncbi:MAG: HlyC/CorC family transporter [Lachnospiraceae bacterium]|nr:HlyC/CorC family transporter [Lachnospiraceae bacterium]
MDIESYIKIVVLLVLVFLSAFFSSAETAFTTVNKIRIRSLAEEGNKAAARVDKILDKRSKMLSAILIGNNIVNISASSLATVIAISISKAVGAKLSESMAVGIMTAVVTIVVLILGEIVPKNWAMSYAEKISFAYSGIIYFIMIVLTPLIFIVDAITKGIQKLLRVDEDYHEAITETELKTYVEAGHEDGVLEPEEREMIMNVFEFSDAEAKDIMIPRVNMVTVRVSDTFEEIRDTFKEHMYTRLPVYEEDEEGEQDHFLGVINIKDLAFCEDSDTFAVRDYLRECLFTHEHKKTADLLEDLRESTASIALVLNEYGDVVGMITLEDLLEEIVGEIRDEYDEDEEELISEIAERTYLVEASMSTDDVNDYLDTDIHSDDYDSIGGIMIEKLDRLPEDGESVVLESGIKLTVRGIEQNRIEKIEIELPEASEEENSDEKEEAPGELEAGDNAGPEE